MMATVGYLEGTDALVLTRLAARGVGTLPLSNGYDNHGKFITSVSARDDIDVIVGYLHKLTRTQKQGFRPRDLLQSCLECGTTVMIVVPEADQALARQVLGPVCEATVLVDPEQLYDSIAQDLGLA
jgi:hypothetical protein